MAACCGCLCTPCRARARALAGPRLIIVTCRRARCCTCSAIDFSLSTGVGFFRKLPHSLRRSVYKACRVEECEKGETLFKQGDPGDRFYIIISGLVNINVSSEWRRRRWRLSERSWW